MLTKLNFLQLDNHANLGELIVGIFPVVDSTILQDTPSSVPSSVSCNLLKHSLQKVAANIYISYVHTHILTLTQTYTHTHTDTHTHL